MHPRGNSLEIVIGSGNPLSTRATAPSTFSRGMKGNSVDSIKTSTADLELGGCSI